MFVRVRVCAAAALVLLVALTGCGDSSEDDDFVLPATSSPTPSPEAPPVDAPATPDFTEEEAAEVAEILSQYEGWRELLIEMYADPPEDRTQYGEAAEEFAWEGIAFNVSESLRAMQAFDVHREGEPTWDARVIELDLDAPEPFALVWDCVDATNWPLVDSETGEPTTLDVGGFEDSLSSFPAERHVVMHEVLYLQDPYNRWMISEGWVERGEQC